MNKIAALIFFLTPLTGYANEVDERMYEIIPVAEFFAESKGLPSWLIVGIIYTETRGNSELIGDNGRGFGLGQIHCGRGGFSWLDFLSKKVGMESCSQLLDPVSNVASIVEIIDHIRRKEKRRKDFSWLNVVTTYNKGNWRKRRLSKAVSYYNRVVTFGKKYTQP